MDVISMEYEGRDFLNPFYMTLGLLPGASPAEIKAAYRRLVKIYHPDRDQSLDAEVRYREVREAYAALRDWHLSGGAGADACGYGGSDMAGRTDADANAGFAEHTAWTAEDWATEYDIDVDEMFYGAGKPVERIPFSLSNLPRIFIASLKELANAGVVLQALLAAFLISLSYRTSFMAGYAGQAFFHAKPYRGLVWIIALASGLASVVLRYYATLRRKPFLCFFYLLSYSIAVTMTVQWFYPEENGLFLNIGLCFFMAFMILALNPLGTLAGPLGFLVRNLYKTWSGGR